MSRSGLLLGLAFLATGSGLACQDSTTNPLTPESSPVQVARGGFPGPPDGGDDTTQECQIGFDLTLDDTQPVRSDGGDQYQDAIDKVQVSTGSGPGFRFDTNGNQKLQGRNDTRLVTLDFTGTAGEGLTDPNVPTGIDFRFDIQPSANSDEGLNLCALDINNGVGTVSAKIRFAVPGTKEGYRLRYGGITSTGNDCGALGVEEIKVTRKGETTWELVSGPTACLLPDRGEIMAVIAMPIAFTITAQP